MEREAIRERLLGILNSINLMSLQLSLPQLSDEMSLLRDLTLDSVQVLELIVELEEQFGFSCHADELSSDLFDRVGNVIDYIARKSAEAQGASA